jgi:hypothetical protein
LTNIVVTAVVSVETPAVSWNGQEDIPIEGQLVAFATVAVVAPLEAYINEP